MTRQAKVATVLAILMTASAIVISTPATVAQTQDTVPLKPGVPLEPLPNLRQFLYLRYSSAPTGSEGGGGTPICIPTGDQRGPFIALAPAAGVGDANTRAPCRYGTSDAASAAVPSSVTFNAHPDIFPKRAIRFTGNESFLYVHGGALDPGVRLRVEVLTGDGAGTSVAAGTVVAPDVDSLNRQPRPVFLQLTGTGLTTGRVEFVPNQTFRVEVRAISGDLGVDSTGASWTLDDRNTYLEIRADNAVRAATWISDERDNVRDVFAPIANESLLPADRDRRLVGHFALESAFGYADASRGDRPRFTLLFDGRAFPIGAGDQTQLQGELNVSASVQELGIAVWSFPPNTVNYRGFPSGEYTLRVDKSHHQGAPINRGIDKRVAITSQSVVLSTFSDPRAPSVIETQAHSVAAGGSTTYILMVNNTGSVNDTFTINVSAPNAAAGWGARIGGPEVLGNRITVPARETRVFTVTVNAPNIGSGEVIHLVNLTSTLDPATRSRDLTLVTRISNEVIREVGIIFLPRETVVEPGVESHFPVYVWNRGTRPMNVSLEIRETAVAGWIADLALGSASVDRIVLGSIPPGDISAATLKITGPANAISTRHDISLNATAQDVAGVSADRALTFTLRTLSGVSVQVLNTVGARQHIAELSGPRIDGADGTSTLHPTCRTSSFGVGPDCTDDGVDGLWFRVWVTNTGRVADTFQLTGDSFRKASNNNCDSAFIPGTGADAMSGAFRFYARPCSCRAPARRSCRSRRRRAGRRAGRGGTGSGSG
ncbi:MAG TPA: hypothetical protein VM582_10520 [Candidatus Thermoplasmatota archaeon]|nr:hypothetical protein [Candidatus Thermoplasmatota archaeon]